MKNCAPVFKHYKKLKECPLTCGGLTVFSIFSILFFCSLLMLNAIIAVKLTSKPMRGDGEATVDRELRNATER